MKSKLFFMAALCAIGFSASAQTEKGKSFINGSIGYTSDKASQASAGTPNVATDQKSKSFNIMPQFGYFVADNFAIGLGIGYVQNKTTLNGINTVSSYVYYSTQTAKQHIFSIQPFARKYVNVADKFKFFGQLSAGIGFGKGENNSVYYSNPTLVATSEDSYKLTSYNASLSPGFAFFPSKKWAIEFSFPLLSYTKTKPKDQSSGFSMPSSETFSFATDSFNPSIGFNFHF